MKYSFVYSILPKVVQQILFLVLGNLAEFSRVHIIHKRVGKAANAKRGKCTDHCGIAERKPLVPEQRSGIFRSDVHRFIEIFQQATRVRSRHSRQRRIWTQDDRERADVESAVGFHCFNLCQNWTPAWHQDHQPQPDPCTEPVIMRVRAVHSIPCDSLHTQVQRAGELG